jgi:hypothetical protein
MLQNTLAFVYSSRKMADALSAERLAFMPLYNHISAVYVTGIAGQESLLHLEG